jgi:hypothetical protein
MSRECKWRCEEQACSHHLSAGNDSPTHPAGSGGLGGLGRREKVDRKSRQKHTTHDTCNVPTGRLSDLDARGCLSGSTTTKCVMS